jgi:hypothetical protein
MVPPTQTVELGLPVPLSSLRSGIVIGHEGP